MLSAAFSSTIQPGGKNLLRAFVTCVTGFSAYGVFYNLNNFLKSANDWKQIENGLKEFKPLKLEEKNAKIYPWHTGNPKDWEYKLVSIDGYFKYERFFVRRTKEGKQGFLVFAPFVTAVQNIQHSMTMNTPQVEHQILVNIGWVPKENLSDIKGEDPVAPIELGTGNYTKNHHTGFDFNAENPIEEEQLTLCNINAIVRRGESQDILRNRRNWKNEGVYNWIDLDFMARFFRFSNLEAASHCYLERVVESYDENQESLYPVPSTLKNFDKPLVGPKTHFNNSLFCGTTSILGFLSLLTVFKKK